MLERWGRVEARLDDVRRMIDADAGCVEVLRRTHAVRQAVGVLEAEVLGGHVRHCMAYETTSGSRYALAELIHSRTAGAKR